MPSLCLRSGCAAALIAACLASLSIAPSADAQLRVATYNIAGLLGDLNALSGVFAETHDDATRGFAVSPHIWVMQEVKENNVATLLSRLNSSAPAGVTYQMATYTNNSENSPGAQACFYRADILTEVAVSHADIFSGAGRYADRWRFRMIGYTSTASELYVYSAHLKASQGSTNEDIRHDGVIAIRNNADALPVATHILYAGDQNFYNNSEPGYTEYLEPGNGQAYDPLGTDNWTGPGNALKHSQSPRLTSNGLVGGGVDDRFDFILASLELNDGQGLAIMPNTYRTFGNDGSHFDTAINSGNNFYFPGETSRSNALADDLHDGSDHMPVLVDLSIPALMDASIPSDFGRVIQGGAAFFSLTVSNGANVVVANGADDLVWFSSTTGDLLGTAFGVETALDAPSNDLVFVNTSSVGAVGGSVVLTSTSQGAGNSPAILSASGSVVRAAAPSFASGEEITETDVDWNIDTDTGMQSIDVPIYNFDFDVDQALLDLDGVQLLLGDATFDSGLQSNIGAAPATLTFHFDTDGVTPGTYTAEFEIDASDEDLPGESNSVLALSFSIQVSGSGVIPGDVDGDGDVDFADLVSLLSAWGPCPAPPSDCPADFDGSGDVGFNDLLTLLASWG